MTGYRNRPARGAGGSEIAVAATRRTIAQDTDTTALFDFDQHGALIAVDAAQGWKRYAVEQAIRDAAKTGQPFAADDIERSSGVLCDANWVGGCFMRAKRDGLIRKAGYRPSTKASRGGSILTIWVGGGEA